MLTNRGASCYNARRPDWAYNGAAVADGRCDKQAVGYFPCKGGGNMKRRIVKAIFQVAIALFLVYILTIKVC